MIRCVSLPPSEFKHPISADLEASVLCLLDALLPGDHVSTVHIVHNLLLKLFCHQNAEGGDRQNFSDPVSRSIVLLSVHPGGSWREANRIAPVLARITWGIRVVNFAEVVICTRDDSSHEYLHE